MSLLFTSLPTLFKNPNNLRPPLHHLSPLKTLDSLSLSFLHPSNPRFLSLRAHSSFPGDVPPDPLSGRASDDSSGDEVKSDGTIVDEWGERAEPDTDPPTKLSDSDPPKDEDEWGTVVGGDGDGGVQEEYLVDVNGSAMEELVGDKLGDLKRCFVDTVYDTGFGFRASVEVRAEALELVNQLETSNPTPAPTEAVELLDGTWVLLYTAFSELLPLLASGTTPLLKVERISQTINTRTQTIENSTLLSNPLATFSFSASAAFEVRSPSRIQVEFKEGTLQPPVIKPNISLPENVDIFGQNINLLPVQQSLNPLQEAVESIARTISGQPPIKVPIPGERTKSWLLFTYLDKDFLISRGDGGLFVLAKEGSPLLDQYK